MSGSVAPAGILIGEKPQVEHAELADRGSDELHEAIDPDIEKKLVWKIDVHVVPPLLILFLLAFLDRTNIGNAKIQGLTTELNMAGQDYNIALLIFFPP
jgi:hypothetical protein